MVRFDATLNNDGVNVSYNATSPNYPGEHASGSALLKYLGMSPEAWIIYGVTHKFPFKVSMDSLYANGKLIYGVQDSAELQRIAAEKAAADAAAEAARIAALEAEQLRLKNEMLASSTATWAEGVKEEAAAAVAAQNVAIPDCGQGTWGVCEKIIVAPPAKCLEGTTRTVKCPKDPNKMVTQRCVNGAWVTLPADEKAACGEDPGKLILAAIIIAIVLVFLRSKV